jgi:outer membrane lipoprotein-sorting protein
MSAPLQRFMFRLFAVILPILVIAAFGRAQSPSSAEDLQSLLKRMEQSMLINNQIEKQYVENFERHLTQPDKNGKIIWQETQKFESVFVNGIWYRRELERNGKTLTEEQREASQKRLDVVSSLDEDYDFLIEPLHGNPANTFRSKLPHSYLTTLFDNRLLRHESIHNRDVLVIESRPRADAHPASKLERSALDWKETIWVDAEDAMPVRYKVELLVDKRGSLRKGSTSQVEFVRLEDLPNSSASPPRSVWLEEHSETTMIERLFGIQLTEVSEITNSNFRRFSTNTRLIEDSVREISGPTEVKHP